MVLPLTLPPTPLLLAIQEFVTPSHSLAITLSLPSYLVSHVSVALETRRGHDAGLPCTRSSNDQQLFQRLQLILLLLLS